MANIFFAGEKASKEKAIREVITHIRNYSDCICAAKVVSDDGGQILEIMVEVPVPSLNLLEQQEDFPFWEVVPKWAGWRTVVLKVPPGYIATVVNGDAD